MILIRINSFRFYLLDYSCIGNEEQFPDNKHHVMSYINGFGTVIVSVYMIESDRRPVSNRRPLLKLASTDVIISNHGPSSHIYRPVYTIKFAIKNNCKDSFFLICFFPIL
jgi:hypothetical protein